MVCSWCGMNMITSTEGLSARHGRSDAGAARIGGRSVLCDLCMMICSIF